MEETLIEAARDALAQSYSPYSHFAVGAALLAADGTVFTGCNIENASFGATVCAERTTLFKAVSEGHREFTAIALVATRAVPPCGMCLQVLSEFCGRDFPVYSAALDTSEPVRKWRLGELLPEAFTL